MSDVNDSQATLISNPIQRSVVSRFVLVDDFICGANAELRNITTRQMCAHTNHAFFVLALMQAMTDLAAELIRNEGQLRSPIYIISGL